MESAATDRQPAQMDWAHLRVPPFPQIALRVLQLAINENVQLSKLGELISSDSAFAGEVLTVVNSLLYAPRYPIRSILQAIEVLGATHLQGLCLTVGVRAYLGTSLAQPTLRTIWRHNLACALIAQQIAAAGTTDRDIAYSAGILHGIGMLALAVVQPKDYIHFLGTYIGTQKALLDRERIIFGINHLDLGKIIVAEWRLPEEFAAVMDVPHDGVGFNGQWGLTQIVSLSCSMANSVGFSAFSACHPTPFSELLDLLPPRERMLFHTDVGTLSFEVSKKIAALESI